MYNPTLQGVLESGHICGMHTVGESFSLAADMLSQGAYSEYPESMKALNALYMETVKEHPMDTPVDSLLSQDDRDRLDAELESYMHGGDADPLADDCPDFDIHCYEYQ